MIQFRIAVLFLSIPRLVLGSTCSGRLRPRYVIHRSPEWAALTPQSQSYHATHVQGATVELDFVGTGVHVFSATVPTPGSYEVYVDGKKLSESRSSESDSQLLLGSITGLEMASHTVTLVNSGVTGNILDLGRVQVQSALSSGRCGNVLVRGFTAYRTDPSVHPSLLQLSTTPLARFSGDLDGFSLRGRLFSTTTPSSAYTLPHQSAFLA